MVGFKLSKLLNCHYISLPGLFLFQYFVTCFIYYSCFSREFKRTFFPIWSKLTEHYFPLHKNISLNCQNRWIPASRWWKKKSSFQFISDTVQSIHFIFCFVCILKAACYYFFIWFCDILHLDIDFMWRYWHFNWCFWNIFIPIFGQRS